EDDAANRVTWLYTIDDDSYRAIEEWYRSDEMIKAKDTPSKTAAEVELLGEERQRLGRAERQLIDRLTRVMTTGQVVFRGILDDLLKIVRNEISYGHIVTGGLLATKLADPPRGATIELVQALCAAGVRSGLLEATYQGAKISTPSDHRLDRVFGRLNDFRSTS